MAVTGLGTNQSVTSPLTVTLTAGASIGDRVLACVARASTAIEPAITDSKGNTWTKISISPAQSINCFIYESVLTSALVASDTVTSTNVGVTMHGMAIVRISDALYAPDPHGHKSFIENTENNAAWSMDNLAREWFTHTTYVAIAFQTGSTARTNTPNAGWTELYDFTVATTRALYVIYRELTSELWGIPLDCGGVISGSTTNFPAQAVSFHRASGAAVSRVNKPIIPAVTIEDVVRTRAGRTRVPIRQHYRSPRRTRGTAPTPITYGQFWPRG